MYGSHLHNERYTAPVGSELGSATSARTTEDERILSLSDILRAVRRWLWVVAIIVLLSVGGVVGYTIQQAPKYATSISILVGQNGGMGQNLQLTQNLQQLTKTMAQGVKSRPVAEAAVQQLGLDKSPDDLLSRLEAEPIADSQFIRVTYQDDSPEAAQQIANAIGDAFSEEVSQASQANRNLSDFTATATVWERAEAPGSAVSPRPVRDGFIALVVGLMLGIGLSVLLEYLHNNWRSLEEVEQISGVPTLGAISNHPKSAP